MQAANYRANATNARRGAQNAADSLRAGASSTLLTGALNLYGMSGYGSGSKKKSGPTVQGDVPGST